LTHAIALRQVPLTADRRSGALDVDAGMRSTDLDPGDVERSTPIDESTRCERQDILTRRLVEDAIITVNTRTSWHQRSRLPIDSPELANHLERLAANEWRRYHGWRPVTVTARRGSDVVEVVHGMDVAPCPQCGFDRRAISLT
jgi:hypothetical protein